MNLVELNAEAADLEKLILEMSERNPDDPEIETMLEELFGTLDETQDKVDAWVRRLKFLQASLDSAKEMQRLYAARVAVIGSIHQRAKDYLRYQYQQGTLPDSLKGKVHSIRFSASQPSLKVMIEDPDDLATALQELNQHHPELIKMELRKQECKKRGIIPGFCQMVDGEVQVIAK